MDQIALSLLSGNKLILPLEEGLTHPRFCELGNAEKLSYLSGTPSVLQQVRLSCLRHLEMLTVAGEEFHPSQYASMRREFAGPIHNVYGITETTVHNLVTTFQGPQAPFTGALRDELPGTKAYVLNDRLQPVPGVEAGRCRCAIRDRGRRQVSRSGRAGRLLQPRTRHLQSRARGRRASSGLAGPVVHGPRQAPPLAGCSARYREREAGPEEDGRSSAARRAQTRTCSAAKRPRGQALPPMGLSSRQTRHGNRSPLRAEQGLVRGTAPLLPIQEWFFSKRLGRPGFWNHCFAMRTPQLDRARLQEAVGMLRTRFARMGGRLVQQFDAEQPRSKPSTRQTWRKHTEWLLSASHSRFDTERGPLFGVVYVSGRADGAAYVWCAFHHLIVDAVSWSVIKSDLQALYSGRGLGAKSSSVQQWAGALSTYTPTSRETEYWDEVRARAARSTRGLPGRSSQALVTRREDALLPSDETAALFRHCCAKLDVGVRHAVFMSVGLCAPGTRGRWGGLAVVTVEGHGREDAAVDASLDLGRTVGWFTSIYPFESHRVAHPVQVVLEVKKRLGAVPARGVGYGPRYGYLGDSLPPVTVNYLGRRMDQTRRQPDDWALAADQDGLPYGLCVGPKDRDGSSSSLLDVTVSSAHGRLSLQVASYCAAGGGADAPLFLLPPGEGGAESYFRNLVQGCTSPSGRGIEKKTHAAAETRSQRLANSTAAIAD